MPYLLQTHQLTKRIQGRTLVAEVEIHVKQGEIYGFLGPNGAGKTTVMKMLTNLWKPTAGSVELFGETLTPSSCAVLRRMGSIIEFPTFYAGLSAAENLRLHCEYMGYYAPGCVEEALALLGLAETGDKPVRRFSLGMKQRLGLARAVLTRPELLILDEPTNGLDPAGIKQIRELLRGLCREYGMTILLSSHILSEVESIADTIGVIHHGRMKQEIPLHTVADSSLAYIELEVGDSKKAAYLLADRLHLSNFRVMEQNKLRVYDPAVTPQELAGLLTQNGVPLLAVGRKAETLEDHFLKLTAEEDAPC